MENKKKLELSEEQLTEVTGGEELTAIMQPTPDKYCAADPTHFYSFYLDACPVCGTKEYTFAPPAGEKAKWQCLKCGRQYMYTEKAYCPVCGA